MSESIQLVGTVRLIFFIIVCPLTCNECVIINQCYSEVGIFSTSCLMFKLSHWHKLVCCELEYGLSLNFYYMMFNIRFVKSLPKH